VRILRVARVEPAHGFGILLTSRRAGALAEKQICGSEQFLVPRGPRLGAPPCPPPRRPADRGGPGPAVRPRRLRGPTASGDTSSLRPSTRAQAPDSAGWPVERVRWPVRTRTSGALTCR